MMIVSRIETPIAAMPIAAMAGPASRSLTLSCHVSEVTGKFQHTRGRVTARPGSPVDNGSTCG
ncbi:hypothetical protein GCM10009733_012870 [Nonomuraea maheshkhaliensis]|uniref:Uncharacterized protein n=1 Tax=Nonomuraea maheshkhaliensis TaxID=419590 RepID=A0ABP4QRV2_9ACTN